MFLEFKLQITFSVTKLIGHPERNSNFHSNKSKNKNLRRLQTIYRGYSNVSVEYGFYFTSEVKNINIS